MKDSITITITKNGKDMSLFYPMVKGSDFTLDQTATRTLLKQLERILA